MSVHCLALKYGVDIRNKPTVSAFLVTDKAIKQSGELLMHCTYVLSLYSTEQHVCQLNIHAYN